MKKRILAVVAIVALVAILGVVLCACNADSYAKKLEKAGYTVVASEADKDDAAIEWTVVGTKGLLGDKVTVTKYADKEDAKDAEAAALKIGGEDLVYRSGKIVIIGTSAQAVKDAK